MENENSNQQVPQSNGTEGKKEERIDELDILGGALVKLVMHGFSRIKDIFIPRKVE
ncbi:MAG: hypothetical protein H0W89_05700 [Candidatus Levybacteria bacterium]|nr:hypothetical protein [Candidatus Levybacteria bacterium]